jgi:hypothetical protein
LGCQYIAFYQFMLFFLYCTVSVGIPVIL